MNTLEISPDDSNKESILTKLYNLYDKNKQMFLVIININIEEIDFINARRPHSF